MDLYLLRHAIAVDRDTPNIDDSERPLTVDGRKKMERVAEAMRALDLEFNWILTSPYLRALQTAEIVADTFELRNQLVACPALASPNVAEVVNAILEKYSGS